MIEEFTPQGLANMVNAYAKMGYDNPELFDEVARAAIPIIHTFNAMDIANTANAFAKMFFLEEISLAFMHGVRLVLF